MFYFQYKFLIIGTLYSQVFFPKLIFYFSPIDFVFKSLASSSFSIWNNNLLIWEFKVEEFRLKEFGSSGISAVGIIAFGVYD